MNNFGVDQIENGYTIKIYSGNRTLFCKSKEELIKKLVDLIVEE